MTYNGMTYEQFREMVSFGDYYGLVDPRVKGFQCTLKYTAVHSVPRQEIPHPLDVEAYQDFCEWEKDFLTREMWRKLNAELRGECNDTGESRWFHCSECGCKLDMADTYGEPTMWLHGEATVPRFCPNCGRVIR